MRVVAGLCRDHAWRAEGIGSAGQVPRAVSKDVA